ncbi:hypothetical protein VCHC50A2_3242B, partial [Vibrio cholerae HC-50A2]
CFI